MSEFNENESPFYDNYGQNETNGQHYNTPAFDEKNYLNTRLGKGETEKTIQIRILPAEPTSNKIYIPVKIHSLKVDKKIAQSGFKTFLCLNDKHLEEHDGRGCPICNKMQEYFNYANECDESEVDKKKAFCKEAFKYQTKTAYILRVIERGKEDEGVKFWRFNHWDNGRGCLDQLKNLYELRKKEYAKDGIENYNIFNLENGRDISLTLTKSKKENSRDEKTEITIMDVSRESPLSRDKNKVDEWVNDPKDWKDMYAFKAYDYLKIVADGKIPVFNKEVGHYVAKEVDEEMAKKAEEEAINEIRNSAPVIDEDVNNDLPF